MKVFNPHYLARCCAIALLAAATTAQAAAPAPTAAPSETPAQIAAAFGTAIASFRQGQLADAYGRFIRLANRGHADSARYALLMCEHGPGLFGRDWDCAPHFAEAWALVAGIAAPPIAIRHYGTTSPLSASGGR